MSAANIEQPQLIVVLGDQLSPQIAALRAASFQRDIVLIAEVTEEATYVQHHKKKIAFVFSAMRHFADELTDSGWKVHHVKLSDNVGSITGEISRAVTKYDCRRVVITEPGEWRLLKEFQELRSRLGVPIDILDDDRFLCSKKSFFRWVAGRRRMRMEDFYQQMRRRTGLLMNGDEPVGGRWNFDRENRKTAKKKVLEFPGPRRFANDKATQQVLEVVERHFGNHFGTLKPFWFGVTRNQAEAAFDDFVEKSLVGFGDYQDAMLSDERFLFHSVISLYLNVGLLEPLVICRRVEDAYQCGDIPLNAAEGFIRQVIGWREYVRGIYWLHMPDYADRNFFQHNEPLPDLYWTGQTDMACLQACIVQTRDEAYAHHIQRLMILGNFALLASIDPKAVHEWYLAVYADAYEWVEMPNTLGMSQFADGGLLGSKPYVASGNYINRMSNYCDACRYKVQQKVGADACPFNYLYWHFMDRNREKLESNPRLRPVFRTWDRMDAGRKSEINRDSVRFLNTLD